MKVYCSTNIIRLGITKGGDVHTIIFRKTKPMDLKIFFLNFLALIGDELKNAYV